MDSTKSDQATAPLDRSIQRLLDASRLSLRAGKARKARREVDGAAALRRIADRLRA